MDVSWIAHMRGENVCASVTKDMTVDNIASLRRHCDDCLILQRNNPCYLPFLV